MVLLSNNVRLSPCFWGATYCNLHLVHHILTFIQSQVYINLLLGLYYTVRSRCYNSPTPPLKLDFCHSLIFHALNDILSKEQNIFFTNSIQSWRHVPKKVAVKRFDQHPTLISYIRKNSSIPLKIRYPEWNYLWMMQVTYVQLSMVRLDESRFLRQVRFSVLTVISG